MTEPDTPETRSIELEVEVDGTAEEVWTAIATGPGIGSWYVPHTVEERTDGASTASFGPGPEMQVNQRVAAWEPPRRIVFDGGDPTEGLAFEWLIEAKRGGTCIVKLVNSGFLVGEEWDDYFDAMTDGWGIFLANLQLHCTHFSGRSATASLPMATWPGPQGAAWSVLTTALGVSAAPSIGDRLDISAGDDTPALGGQVVAVAPHRISLLLDTPAEGTGFLAAEGRGEHAEVSIWTYLYGEAGRTAAEHDDPLWRAWLSSRA
jgi:uncharacterized protein YndB with AHSA1/START domain